MGTPRLFKLPSHSTFNFKTRYYDADKEELDKRVKEAKKKYGVTEEANGEKGKYTPNIKGQMKHHRSTQI